MTSAKKIPEHGEIPNLRDYMPNQNMAAGAETFAATMDESRREIMGFIAKRLEKDSEAVREAIDCANWGDAMQVQSRWAREMIEDYGAEMGRLLAMFNPKQASPRDERRRTRS
jgi:hypothetical protein